MFVEQIYTKCLAEAAYYVESNGEAAIIDPLREVEPYIQMANERGAKIKYVFETHFHADFVSGHIDLAKQTGATIVFGPNAEANYDIYNGNDGEVFIIGDVSLNSLTHSWSYHGVLLLFIERQLKEINMVCLQETLFL